MTLIHEASGGEAVGNNLPTDAIGVPLVEDGSRIDIELRDKLILENIGLADIAVAPYSHNNPDHREELTAFALYELVKISGRFDEEMGVSFSTFAIASLRGSMKRYFRDYGWDTKVSRTLKELGTSLKLLEGQLEQELGHSPTVSDLAVSTGYTEEQVSEALLARNSMRANSYHSPRTDAEGEESYFDQEADDLPLEEMAVDHVALSKALSGLDSRAQKVVFLRFWEGLSQQQIAEQVGTSQVHVSRILSTSLEKMRRGLKD